MMACPLDIAKFHWISSVEIREFSGNYVSSFTSEPWYYGSHILFIMFYPKSDWKSNCAKRESTQQSA